MSWKEKKKRLDLLAREKGVVRKVWGTAIPPIGLAYPNVYRTGMPNLGFQTVYRLINDRADCLCERFFLPCPETPAGGSTTPADLISLESQQPAAAFGVLAFSISFENDYPNILTMLAQAGIPLLAAERGERDPLIIAGGIAVTLNPEPLADFFDLFLLGEAEALLTPFLEALRERRGSLSREAFLAHLQETVPGAYVPGCYRVAYDPEGRIARREPLSAAYPERIKRCFANDINAFTTDQGITAEETEFGGMFLVEVSRGCGRGCRFCAAGYLCRPLRFRSRERLEASIAKGLELGKTIGLVGTAVSDHPELQPLCRAIVERQGRFAIGSLRMDRLDGPTLALLKQTGVETLSLGLEAGSQRLRNVIHKGISEAQIETAADNLLEYDMTRLRLYFMIGLPTERDDDIEAIIRLVRKMVRRPCHASERKRGFRRLTLSINQFIPKPATPFQWHPLEGVAAVNGKIHRIASAFKGERSV
ncbi:MAG: radical SAM protein, partial [Syntrophaceae bacterium]|nr:radical SAM protein [Syntrophaceae bacterium]